VAEGLRNDAIARRLSNTIDRFAVGFLLAAEVARRQQTPIEEIDRADSPVKNWIL